MEDPRDGLRRLIEYYQARLDEGANAALALEYLTRLIAAKAELARLESGRAKE